MQDLRLGLPAIIVWLVATLGGVHSLAGAGAAILVLAAGAHAFRIWGGEREWSRLVVLGAACVFAGSLTSFVHYASEQADPVSRAAQMRSWVRIEAVVTERVQNTEVFGSHAASTVVRAERVEQGATSMTSSGLIRITAHDDALAGVETGSTIVFGAKLKEAEHYDSALAYATISSIESHDGPKGVQAVSNWLHRLLMSHTEWMPTHASALVPGIVVGDDSRLPDDDVEMMRILGLSHLTAVSGVTDVATDGYA